MAGAWRDRAGLSVIPAAIRLYTHERMLENIKIYGKLGYQETRRAVEDGFARVFMRKSLVGPKQP